MDLTSVITTLCCVSALIIIHILRYRHLSKVTSLKDRLLLELGSLIACLNFALYWFIIAIAPLPPEKAISPFALLAGPLLSFIITFSLYLYFKLRHDQ